MEKTTKCSRIEQIWESFVVAENESFERSSWFDIFLSEFLIEIKDGKQPSEIVSFSSSNVIASIIAAEFLRDVHNISVQAGNEEFSSLIRQHLLNGRGWRCLAVLQCLGVQDVSYSQELASLFISVFAICNEVSQTEASKNPFISQISKASFRSLDDIIKLKSPRVRKKSNTHALSNDSASSGSRRADSGPGLRSKFQRNLIRGPAGRSPESSDTDVVASIPSDPKSTLNKSSLFKLRFNTIELDDFPSMSENDSGDRLMSAGPHKGAKESLNPNDFVSNSVNIVLKNRLNVFEVSHLLINLLSELCLAQNIVLTSSADNLQQLVIVQALNFSLENLCSLQFNAVKNKHYSPSQIYLLKLALLKLLLQIVHKMKDQSTFSAIILNSGVVPILIRLLEDIVPKYQEDKPPVEPQILQEFIFGSLYLLILILDYFLKQKSFLQKDKTLANDKLSNFLQIFQNVIDSYNGKLVYKIIEIILNFPSISFKITDYRIKKLIFLIGEMIITIKRIRAKINHSEKCKRSKHKQCLSSFLAASSHHHDSFGHVYTNTISLLPNSSVKYTCAVTSLTNLLVKLLNEKMNSELFSYILQVLKMCGTCCCFNISHLLGKFLNILSLDPRCIDLALKVLEEKMFYDLGVIEGISQCKVCFGKVASPTNTDSLSSFVNYKKLFLSAEPKIAKPVAIHLLKLVPFFIKSIQRILLIEVFYPSFVETKSACSLSDLQKAEKSIMANCLSAFIHLINYGQLHDEFMQLGGLKHLEDLITIHDFTKLCALILETIIVVKVSSSRSIKNSTQEYKSSRRSSEAGFRTRSNLIEMTVNEDLQEFEIIISHLKLVQQEFLSILSDCRFESCPNDPEETIHKMSIKESLLNNLDYSHTEKSTTFDVILNDLNQQPTIVFCDARKLASYTNLLNILSELWRSCTNIILMSTSMAQSFTKLLASQHCSTMTCILLRLISKEFYVKASGESVKLNSLHFKLLEALIPLHLALSPPAEITNMIENELKSSLTLVIKSNRVTIRQICDLLTKCAVKMTNRRPSTASASMVVCSKSMSYIFNGMEEEVLSRKRQMMAFIDERVEEIADEGYEADVEIPTWADSDQDLSEKSLEDNCSHRSSSILSEERKYILLYPQLCILLFDLLCSQQCKEKSNDESTVYCLQKMLALCKDHPINCSLLSEYNFILRLISGFSQQLSTTHPSPTPLQLILVDFFFHLARHNIQTHHLAAYFELFKNDNPPLEVLLSPLLGLANSMKTQPSYILNFPLELKDPPRGENPAEKMCNSMCVGHRSAGILSPWNISAVCLPVNIDCGWSMWTDKFSVSLWLRMRNRQLMMRQPGSIYTSAESINSQDSVFFNGSLISSESGESLIHIFSIGHDSFLVEFWGSSISDTLHIRLSLNDGSSQKILTESCVDGILPPSLWHHLAINFKDTIQKMLVVIEVTLIVNGSWEIQIPLMFTGILIKKARPTCILIGDTRPTNNIWSLSNFGLFRSPVFNKELALLLCAYGPDFSCLTESSVGDPLPNFINLIDKKNWAAVNWASILSKNLTMKNLKSLQESLFVLYSARDPNSFYIYQHSLSGTTGVIAAQPPSLFRISNVDNRASQKVPLSATVMCMSNLCVQKYSGFTQALDALGGLNVLLFLFAKVVELGAEEKYQADVLYILLKMATSDNQLYIQFIKGDSYKLILKVLQSRKAKAGYHILKALFDAACDKPGLIQCQSSNSFFVASPSNHILVHPELLVYVALPTWQQWELKDATCNQDSILCLLFKALHVLLSDSQFNVGEFNVEQLNRCALLDAVLNFCKQRFQYKEKSLELEPSVCCSIIELLRGLMGAPPQLNQVKAIFKYVLLAHDDSATYITTARSKFYFLLTPEPPPSGKSSRKRGSVLSSRQRTRNDSNSASELSISHSFRSKVLDATKLSKALTNLQIQQNMVSKSSSPETNHSAESTQLEDICEFHVDPSLEVDGDVSKWQENRGFESVDEFIAQCEEKNANRALNQYYRGTDHTDSGPKERKVIDPNDIVIIGMDNEFHEDSSLDSSEESNKEKIEKFLAENMKETTLNQRENTLERSSEYLIMEGLLVLLRDTFLVLPDHMVTILTDKIIGAASLLAMLNHPDDGVRTAVIKVFSAYLQRCSEDLKSKFINRMKGFYHLANQLSLYPNSSAELVETCVALVTGCFWLPLEEQLEAYDALQDSLSPQQLAAVPTVLAFLPTSISNITLMGNLVHFLHSLYCKVQEAAKQMLSFGLVEVLCKTLVRIAHDCPMQEVTDLVDQLQQFFGSIVTNAVQSPGSSSIHVLNEMLLMICFLESEECLSCGVKSECIHLLREVHRSVLDTAVETIIDMITSQQIRATTVTRIRNTTAAILSSVLSSSYEDDKDTLPPSNMTSSFSTSMSNLSFTTSLSTPSILSVSKPKQISRSELVDRFKIIVNHCMDFIISTELPGHVCKEETEFACHIFSVLLNGVAAVVEKKSSSRSSSNWNMVMWRSRDILRNQAATLFLWLLAPFQSDKTRMFAINTISNEAQVKDILFSLLLTNTQIEQKFILFLWDLMYNGSSLLPTEMEVCEELKEQLLTWDIVSAQAFGHAHDRWQKDVALAVKDFDMAKLEWEKSVEPSITKCIFKWETLVGTLVELGAAMTTEVVESQHRQKKGLLELMKVEHSKAVDATMRWQSIVQQLTHERAVWYSPDAYLRAWQLDPTEGPGRVRNRLQRCNLNIDNRFFKLEYRNKHGLPTKTPLSYLQTSNCDAKNVLLIDKLHTSEKIVHMCTCQIVQPASEVSGELLIGAASIYFIPNVDAEESMELEGTSIVMKFDEIKEYHNRRYQLQERAIEMFLLNGRTYLIAFQSAIERDNFVKMLSECPLPNRVNGDVLIDAVQLWREGLLSNWDYLTLLNKMAGRSYNDLMQYPVMPFILADYTSQVLDLTNPASFRNLKKPMAVQDKKNEQHYIGSYNYLKQELTDAVSMMTPYQEPYHYGSHYSNSGTVLHFLVRVPPFTQMFLNYQDENFDLPDRTFHSLHTTWRLTSSESTTDVKEIIPEFFCLPEFLTNPHGFNFGLRQNGERVDDVQLPPWANSDPRLFILIHRQALESEYVRENLPHWIDLVFGYKQTGKPAVDAINVFHPATYYGFDVDSIPDQLERIAWQTMIRTYGQTPRQLFTAPHPMIVQTLTPKITVPTRPVFKSVKGLQWGSFVGSPAEQVPSVVWRHQHRIPVASLVPLLTNDVFGLAPKTSLLLSYAKERTLSLVSREDTVLGCAVASWGHADNVIRLKLRKEKPPKPIIRTSPLDPVTICASAPDCSQLWVGHESGNITIYRYTFNYNQGSVDLNQEPVKLLGHAGPVLSLSVNRAFSIVLSGSADGSAIIWDLNKLTYVRSVPAINLPINLVSVSSTLGDIVTVGSETDNSILRLHSINVTLIGSLTTTPKITSVCFSTAPEGLSVNVIATGMENGTVKLWSTWDLSPVGEICVNNLQSPIIGLTYSHDSQHLYASAADGVVVIWEGTSTKTVSKTPNFLNLTL
nr:PREDICTED: lysosomal-trafficking regulator [Bemisia tabaci]